VICGLLKKAIASFFKYDILYSCAAVTKIPTDFRASRGPSAIAEPLGSRVSRVKVSFRVRVCVSVS